MALAVERIHLILIIVVKALLREVVQVAIQLVSHCQIMMLSLSLVIILWPTHHLPLGGVPHKVMMCQGVRVEEVYK